MTIVNNRQFRERWKSRTRYLAGWHVGQDALPDFVRLILSGIRNHLHDRGTIPANVFEVLQLV
jgi:hypothetical protein